MQKFFKIAVIGLAAVVMLFATGCSDEKTFSKSGITITLTNDFYEKDLLTASIALFSDEYLFTGLKEDLTSLSSVGIYESSTLEEYLAAVKSNNMISAAIIKDEENEIIYIMYESVQSGKNFTYLVTAKKGQQAFYFFNFACETDKFDTSKDKFIKWAKSITVE